MTPEDHGQATTKKHHGIEGCRVYAANPNVKGTVVTDSNGPTVRVKWDDGDDTWARRDLLYLIGEWSSVCDHADLRYFPDEKRAIACMACGRLFGHLDERERMIPHNPTQTRLGR